MNWDDLRIFLSIARVGSISGGARRLGVQHSTVSRRLRKLEESLGVRLLDKKPSGYELTPAGEDLREAALRMEREVVGVDANLTGQDRSLQGQLRVTTVGNLAHSLLIPVLARFSERYSDIALELTVSNVDVSLPEREADIALRLTNSPPETLIGRKVGTVASTVYGSREYLEQMEKNDEVPQWIGVDCCDYHRRWTRTLSGGEASNLTVDEPLITHKLLQANRGLAILPCHIGDSDPALTRFQEPLPEMDVDLWMLYHPDLKRTERVRVFCDYLVAEFAELANLLKGKAARR